MFCSNCGAEIPEGSRFCKVCGTATASGAKNNPAVEKHPAAEKSPASEKDLTVSKVGERVVEGVNRAVDGFDAATGGTGHAELRFGDLFSEAFKRHAKGDAEEIFTYGTKSTTPDIHDVSAEWPHPWVWSRVLAIMVVVVFSLVALAQLKEAAGAVPCIIILGSAAVPLSLLIFFYETNVWRNVSIAQTMSLFLVGGLLSTLTLFFDSLFGLDEFIGYSGNIIESLVTAIVKLTSITAIIVLALQQRSGGASFMRAGKNYILNGMLIGAAIGAGFAVFDNSAVAFSWWFDSGLEALNHAIIVLTVVSFARYVMWGAAIGGALAMTEGENGFEGDQLTNPRFLVVAVTCLVLHTLWYARLPLLDDILIFGEMLVKYAILAVVIWIVVVVLINRGISQVNEVSKDETQESA